MQVFRISGFLGFKDFRIISGLDPPKRGGSGLHPPKRGVSGFRFEGHVRFAPPQTGACQVCTPPNGSFSIRTVLAGEVHGSFSIKAVLAGGGPKGDLYQTGYNLNQLIHIRFALALAQGLLPCAPYSPGACLALPRGTYA